MSRVGRYVESGGVILSEEPLEALIYDAKRGVLLSRLRVFYWFRVYVTRKETPPPEMLEFVADAIGGVLDGEWAEFRANAYKMFNPLRRSRMPGVVDSFRARPAAGHRWNSLEIDGREVSRNIDQMRDRATRLWHVQELLLDLRELPDRARHEAIVADLQAIYATPGSLV